MNADHRVRDGLADLIGLCDDIDIVATTGDTTAAINATRDLQPDTVVLDPRLPETDDGLALIYHMRVMRPPLRVVVLWSPECGDASAFEDAADESLDTCVDATTFSDALIAAIWADPVSKAAAPVAPVAGTGS